MIHVKMPIPSELTSLIVLLEELNQPISDVFSESESKEYNAFDFKIDNFSVKFRTSKITPTKNGQFVTLYKRIESGTIAPFDMTDKIDFVIICSKKRRIRAILFFQNLN